MGDEEDNGGETPFAAAVKKMEFDKNELRSFSEKIFVREMQIKAPGVTVIPKGDKEPPAVEFTPGEEKRNEGKPFEETLLTAGENAIIGTLNLNGGSWRILGIRHRRPDDGNKATEYDVLRLRKTDSDKGDEVLTNNKMEHVLRLCRVEDSEGQKKFKAEYDIIQTIRQSVRHNRRFLDCFPKVFGYDRLKELTMLRSNGKGRHSIKIKYTMDVLRPFYVMEKIEPNLETVMKAPSKAGLGSFTAVFLTIGCMNALRHLHQMGIVHRNVQPSMFAVRLGYHGKLHRKENELSHRVAIVGFSLCRNYRNEPLRKNVPHVGVIKYSSPAAMRRQELTSVDDCVCCLYMLYEMLAGTLPWINSKAGLSFKRVLEEKEKLESLVNVMDHEKKLAFENLMAVFSEIRKANGWDKSVDYEGVADQLRKGVEQRTDGGKDQVVFGFQHPTMVTYRHGVMLKDGKLVSNDGLERAENTAKADFLFPASRNEEGKS